VARKWVGVGCGCVVKYGTMTERIQFPVHTAELKNVVYSVTDID